MDLNIVQLYKGIIERQKQRTQAFDKVLVKCQKYIKMVTNADGMRCLFQVPDFMWGVPPYDLEECIRYVMSQLEKGGFYVKYYFPNVLYISWDINDLEKREDIGTARAKARRKGGGGDKLTPLNLEPQKVADNLKLIDAKKRVDLGKSIVKRRPMGKFMLTLE